MKLLKDLQKLIKNGKMGIDSWMNFKYLIWFIGNFYFWYSDYSLTDFILINFMIALINHCAKVHSAALGMMAGFNQAKEFDRIEKHIHNMYVDDIDVN
tara:strand:+ start:261 stop:554 length:294 start_codon:yes stop_codon:yes gene_type:complete